MASHPITEGVLCSEETTLIECCHVSTNPQRYSLCSNCSRSRCWCRVLSFNSQWLNTSQHLRESGPVVDREDRKILSFLIVLVVNDSQPTKDFYNYVHVSRQEAPSCWLKCVGMAMDSGIDRDMQLRSNLKGYAPGNEVGSINLDSPAIPCRAGAWGSVVPCDYWRRVANPKEGDIWLVAWNVDLFSTSIDCKLALRGVNRTPQWN